MPAGTEPASKPPERNRKHCSENEHGNLLFASLLLEMICFLQLTHLPVSFCSTLLLFS